jgi:hypothetical protein
MQYYATTPLPTSVSYVENPYDAQLRQQQLDLQKQFEEYQKQAPLKDNAPTPKYLYILVIFLFICSLASLYVNWPLSSSTCIHAPAFQWTAFLTSALAPVYCIYFFFIWFIKSR